MIPRPIRYEYKFIIPIDNNSDAILISPSSDTTEDNFNGYKVKYRINSNSIEAIDYIYFEENKEDYMYSLKDFYRSGIPYEILHDMRHGEYESYDRFCNLIFPDFLDLGYIAINNSKFVDENRNMDLNAIVDKPRSIHILNRDWWNEKYNYIALGQTLEDETPDEISADNENSYTKYSSNPVAVMDQYYYPLRDHYNLNSINYTSSVGTLLYKNYEIARDTYNNVIKYHIYRFNEDYSYPIFTRVTDSGILVLTSSGLGDTNIAKVEFNPYSINRFDFNKLSKSTKVYENTNIGIKYKLKNVKYNNNTVFIQYISSNNYYILGSDTFIECNEDETLLTYRGINIKLKIDDNYKVSCLEVS
jgi:hypothetical protein